MSARSTKQLDEALIAYLRTLPGAAAAAAARAELGCSAGELKAARERLQCRGKLLWNKLELAPSMRQAAAPAAGGHASDLPALGNPSEAGGGEQHSAAEPVAAAEEGVEARLPPAATPSPAPLAPPVPPPSPRPSLAEEVAAEAQATTDRRRGARKLSGLHVVAPLTLVERVQTLAAETPADLIAAITRKHPQLWQRAIMLGRACGAMPATVVYDALDRGLTAIEGAAARP